MKAAHSVAMNNWQKSGSGKHMAQMSSGNFLAMQLNNGVMATSEIDGGGDSYPTTKKMGTTSTSAINYQMFLKKKSGTLSSASQPHGANTWQTNSAEPESPMLNSELVGKFGKFGQGI